MASARNSETVFHRAKSRIVSGIINIDRALPARLRSKVHEVYPGRLMSSSTKGFLAGMGPQPYVIRSGPNKGMVIHTSLKDRISYFSGIHEPEVASALCRHVREGMTVADIGANHGYFTILCSSLARPGGMVYAFEPEPENFRLLRDTIDANGLDNVEAHQLAVWSRSETRTLNLAEPLGGRHSLVSSRSDRTIEVEAVALDDFVQDNDIESVEIVKIDVEGGELEVLDGMTSLIERCGPLVLCEFHGDELAAEGNDFLERRGYTVTVLREKGNVQVLAMP